MTTRMVVACLLAISSGTSAYAQCRADTVFLRGAWGQARFGVEIADSVDERAQGLMNRPALATSAGMLFVFERTHSLSFWMKNTLIPLDLIFMDARGVVTHIHHNAVPLDTSPLPSVVPSKYVLEINGGLARSLGISVGSEVQHQTILQENAIWPC